jgi:hypothetical protein
LVDVGDAGLFGRKLKAPLVKELLQLARRLYPEIL